MPGGQPSRYRNYWALILGAQTGAGVLPRGPGATIGGGGGSGGGSISFSIGRHFRFTFGG